MKMTQIHFLRPFAVALTLGALCTVRSVAQTAEDPAETPETLWKASEAAWTAKTPDLAIPPLKKLLALEKTSVAPDRRIRAQGLLGECLIKVDRRAEARKAYETFIADEPSAVQRQDWWLSIARIYQSETNWTAAVAALENVLTAQADKPGYKHWYTALSMIAEIKVREDDLDGALEAARDCLDIADTKQACNTAPARIKDILRSLDKNKDRANLFMDFHRYGPFGQDGLKGTEDDLVNPLDSIPRAAPSQGRVAAFTAAEKTLGYDTQSLVQRGLMLSLLGRKKEACAVLLEACRRASGNDVSSAYGALLFLGVQGIRGHMADLSGYMTFLRYGPAGSAESGALSDPFASLGLPKFKSQPTAQEVADLRYVEKRLEGIVLDASWPDKGRRDAASALLNIHSALGDWGDAGVLTWYAERLESEKEANMNSVLFNGFVAASREGRVDWGETPKKLATVEKLPSLQKVFANPALNPMLVLQKLEETLSSADKKK